MTTQITAKLPQNIPAPQFQLFQTVRIKTCKEEGTPKTGVIVGMEYVTLFTAITNGCSTYGWEYEIDFYFGADMERLLEVVEYETTKTFRESKLEAAK